MVHEGHLHTAGCPGRRASGGYGFARNIEILVVVVVVRVSGGWVVDVGPAVARCDAL